MTPEIITANRLHDGSVVYFSNQRGWVTTPEQATIAVSDDILKDLLTSAEAGTAKTQVVGIYSLAVTLEDGAVRPLGQREQVRSSGPSIMLAPGVQEGVRAHVSL